MVIFICIIFVFALLWSIAVCSANRDDKFYCDKCGRELKYGEICRCGNRSVEFLIAENNRQKKELTILRNYIHHNNLECDVMAYYGRNDESEGKDNVRL